MFPPDPPPGRARWIALAALLALIAGLGVAYMQWRPPRKALPPVEAAPLPAVDAGDGPSDVERELAKAATAADSAEIKQRWVDEVKEIDAGLLDAPRREIFIRFANAERCTCGCGFTLAGCRAYDSSCEVSLPRVRALFDSVLAGQITSAAGTRRRPS